MSDFTNKIEKWANNLPKRSAPTYSQRHLFQITHCGPMEIRVKNGNEEIWADGIDLQSGELLEAKYIENPKNSPYVSGSIIPPFIRAKAVGDVENEFRRYAAVINDPNTPVIGLRLIVNIKEAAPFFDNLLQKFNIPGRIVIIS